MAHALAGSGLLVVNGVADVTPLLADLVDADEPDQRDEEVVVSEALEQLRRRFRQ